MSDLDKVLKEYLYECDPRYHDEESIKAFVRWVNGGQYTWLDYKYSALEQQLSDAREQNKAMAKLLQDTTTCLKASEAEAIRKAANAIYEDMREVTASEHHPILSIFRAKLEKYASSIKEGKDSE